MLHGIHSKQILYSDQFSQFFNFENSEATYMNNVIQPIFIGTMLVYTK